MKVLFLAAVFTLTYLTGFTQSITTSFYDESNGLYITSGTSIINDDTANGGKCIFRPASEGPNTFWFGPYISINGGNYLFQARIKVASNSSSSGIFFLDIVSNAGSITHGGIWIRPNMFKAVNEWQLITIPVSIPNGITNAEFRGINLQSGITDVYVDYVQLLPSGFSSFYSDAFTVTAKGDVGISTNNPREKLSVNGNIRAKEVKVEQNNWPDYVFGQNYQLTGLQELEEFIKENKHLPNMPSAKEITKNGLELGEIVRLQQQKIEELTLHLIDKDKTINGILKRMNELEKKIKK